LRLVFRRGAGASRQRAEDEDGRRHPFDKQTNHPGLHNYIDDGEKNAISTILSKVAFYQHPSVDPGAKKWDWGLIRLSRPKRAERRARTTPPQLKIIYRPILLTIDKQLFHNNTFGMIELNAIRKTYRQGGSDIHALDGIDLHVGSGEFIAIMGPSGSGKSTLLNVLGGLDRPDSGRYRLAQDEISALDDDAASDVRNRRIGFVFQSFHLLPRLTVLENVLLPQRYARTPDPDAPKRARALLERIGLGKRLDHLPGQLSGGQLQRAAIARALLNEPDLLLADEPTGNLDSNSAADVMALLRELHASGQTLVLVTHDPAIAASAQRTIHLRDGRVAGEQS